MLFRSGDIINIDIPAHKLELKISNAELRQRLKKLPPFESPIKSGYLKRYVEKVGPANEGAVFAD